MADVAHSTTSITGGHTNAVAGGAAGFMSGTDKTSLDNLSTGAAQAVLKNGTVAFTADQSMGAHKLTSVTDPASDQDASTKAYSDTPHPATVLRMGTDFASGFTGTLSSAVPVEGAIAVNVGTGATVSVLSTGNTDTIIGVAQCSSGTTATGLSIIVFSATGLTTGGGTIRPVTAGKIIIDMKVSIATLSTGTETFNFLGGLCDSFNTISNGIYFSHDANTDTHWTINTKSGGSTTSTNTTVTVTAGQEYHLVAIKDAGANSVTFYVDNVNVGTINTNIPTGQNLVPGGGLKKSAGTTARTCNIDWAYFTQIYTRAA